MDRKGSLLIQIKFDHGDGSGGRASDCRTGQKKAASDARPICLVLCASLHKQQKIRRGAGHHIESK
jgi:hypothetical protein